MRNQSPTLLVTAKPDIAEIEIDKFSSTSAVITDETIRDLHAADLASALRNTPHATTQLALSAALKADPYLFAVWALVARAARSRHISTTFR